MKGVGEEVVSQGVVSLPMGMERDCRRMRMYMYPAMGPSNNINLLDLGPARPLNRSNLNNKYGCHEGSWGGGCFSGCCFSAYGYGKGLQAHVNVCLPSNGSKQQYDKPAGFGALPAAGSLKSQQQIQVS